MIDQGKTKVMKMRALVGGIQGLFLVAAMPIDALSGGS
jgi:hypothetical protein